VKQSAAADKATNRRGHHKKVTYTLAPEVVEAVDKQWRFHKTLNATLADSKSEYIADLIRRDTAKKSTSKSR
jgi:hypothetical protein